MFEVRGIKTIAPSRGDIPELIVRDFEQEITKIKTSYKKTKNERDNVPSCDMQ